MKLLAFSDLHCNEDAARAIVQASSDADVVIGAGDFGTEYQGIGEVIDILRLINKPSILVPGNHDRLCELQALCSEWRAAYVLHAKQVIIEGISFFGLGMQALTFPRRAINNLMNESDISAALPAYMNNDILVTHMPPFDGPYDISSDGVHEGSKAIRSFLQQGQTKLCLCGHIHSSWGAAGMIGDCVVANLGPTPNWYEF